MNQELVEAAARGGQADIERLIEAAWPDAYRLARSVLGDASAAQDVAQEACVALYRSIAGLRSADAFRVWFYRIVVREATDYQRRRRRAESISGTVAETQADPTDALDVWRALDRLPSSLRKVVVLHYFEDLSSREIARILRIPDGTVRFRLMVARRRLRPLLGELLDVPHTASGGHAHAI
jgi:RNA polymerase sigma-70 factor (ECF subfamily)